MLHEIGETNSFYVFAVLHAWQYLEGRDWINGCYVAMPGDVTRMGIGLF